MDKETSKIAKKFLLRIKRKFEPEKVILFGSRARGDHFKGSDFDFIVVSKKFQGVPFLQRLSEIYDYWDAEFDIEAICYTPEEFGRKVKEHGMVRKAVKEGVVLA